MARQSPREYRFGPFALDPIRGSLRKRGKSIPTDSRLIRFLIALVERHGQTVPHEFLKREFWPGHTGSGNLDVLVCQTRKLLRDDPRNPRFIRTHRARGYQFICPVRTVSALVSDEGARAKAIATCEKARHRWSLRTPLAIRESIQLYKQAIKEDPTYSLAWAGRADAWIMAGIHCLIPPAEAFLRARSDAADALRITPNLPEAIVSEAWVKLCFDRDLVAAKRNFTRALQLKPEYPFAHNGLALLHIARGNPHRAVKAMEKAWRVKAASPFLNALLADALYHTRNYEKAAQRARFAVESDPDFAVGHACLGKIRLQQRSFEESILHLELACKLSGNNPIMLGFLANAFGTANRTQSVTKALRQLLHPSDDRHSYVPSYFVALAQLGLGRSTDALKQLAKAIDERSHWVLFLRTEPMFDSLRRDRRFHGLLRAFHGGRLV